MRPTVFLDRDGVIIANRDDYVKNWGEVRFLPAALEALQRLSRSTYVIVMVTNQSVVGRGILTLEQTTQLNARIVAEIERYGGRVDASYLCPHHPAAACSCRKPAPGLLLQAAVQLQLDLQRSYLVGDALSDLQAAQAAGVRGILVLSGRGTSQLPRVQEARLAYQVVPDLAAAVAYVLGDGGIHR
jgi:D-glycero-D-manno-heptose 1,7-bisphosphate phosphatase